MTTIDKALGFFQLDDIIGLSLLQNALIREWKKAQKMSVKIKGAVRLYL